VTHLQSLLQAGKPVIVYIPAPPPPPLPGLGPGLYRGHAYEVLSVRQGTVYLRNPWNTDHPAPLLVRDFLDLFSNDYATLEW
jgi:hypothetical protein